MSLGSEGATELGGTHTYRLGYGNRGTATADGVELALAIPVALNDVRFSVQPTAIANGTATWRFDALQAVTTGGPIEITGVIGGTGSAVARAAITTTAADVNASNNGAEVADDLVAIAMPTITGPDNALVGVQPAFFGTGKPSATVSLNLAGTDGGPGQLLGTGQVDGDGRWEITPTSNLPEPGWHWFTATQQLGELVSPVTGMVNYYSKDLAIDSNSLTVNGKRVGGVDQSIAWPEGTAMTFGARIVSCADPVSPTLLADFFDAHDVVVNRQVIDPARTEPDGYVEFVFQVPRVDQEVEWQLSLAFYCKGDGQSRVVPTTARLAGYVAEGPLDWLGRKLDCWFWGVGCKPPEPPPPPPPCEGCKPWKPEKRPGPGRFDPPKTETVGEGYVVDGPAGDGMVIHARVKPA